MALSQPQWFNYFCYQICLVLQESFQAVSLYTAYLLAFSNFLINVSIYIIIVIQLVVEYQIVHLL